MRLIKRGHARYDRPASEIVVLDGPAGDLQQPLIHYNYETIVQFRAKQTFRIDFEATNLYRRGEKCKFYSPYYHDPPSFLVAVRDAEGLSRWAAWLAIVPAAGLLFWLSLLSPSGPAVSIGCEKPPHN